MSERELPALFIPHGAGPCFFMAWDPPEAWDRMGAWLRRLVDRVGGKPEALLVVSAHWQADVFTVNTRTAHELLFDYYGFPKHTYRITWPARGDAGLAADVVRRLEAAGLDTAEHPHRGLDHGVFIPMKLAFPEADVPVVQLSLKSGLEPGEHVAAGRALQALRRQGILIVGSGMSYHNMAHFRHGGGETDPDSERFDRWLAETVALERTQRERRLLDWASAPGGRASHPVEEHLIPLHVVAGAAGAEAGRRVFQDTVIGSVQSAFMFG